MAKSDMEVHDGSSNTICNDFTSFIKAKKEIRKQKVEVVNSIR